MNLAVCLINHGLHLKAFRPYAEGFSATAAERMSCLHAWQELSLFTCRAILDLLLS